MNGLFCNADSVGTEGLGFMCWLRCMPRNFLEFPHSGFGSVSNLGSVTEGVQFSIESYGGF